MLRMRFDRRASRTNLANSDVAGRAELLGRFDQVGVVRRTVSHRGSLHRSRPSCTSRSARSRCPAFGSCARSRRRSACSSARPGDALRASRNLSAFRPMWNPTERHRESGRRIRSGTSSCEFQVHVSCGEPRGALRERRPRPSDVAGSRDCSAPDVPPSVRFDLDVVIGRVETVEGNRSRPVCQPARPECATTTPLAGGIRSGRCSSAGLPLCVRRDSLGGTITASISCHRRMPRLRA